MFPMLLYKGTSYGVEDQVLMICKWSLVLSPKEKLPSQEGAN